MKRAVEDKAIGITPRRGEVIEDKEVDRELDKLDSEEDED